MYKYSITTQAGWHTTIDADSMLEALNKAIKEIDSDHQSDRIVCIIEVALKLAYERNKI